MRWDGGGSHRLRRPGRVHLSPHNRGINSDVPHARCLLPQRRPRLDTAPSACWCQREQSFGAIRPGVSRNCSAQRRGSLQPPARRCLYNLRQFRRASGHHYVQTRKNPGTPRTFSCQPAPAQRDQLTLLLPSYASGRGGGGHEGLSRPSSKARCRKLDPLWRCLGGNVQSPQGGPNRLPADTPHGISLVRRCQLWRRHASSQEPPTSLGPLSVRPLGS